MERSAQPNYQTRSWGMRECTVMFDSCPFILYLRERSDSFSVILNHNDKIRSVCQNSLLLYQRCWIIWKGHINTNCEHNVRPFMTFMLKWSKLCCVLTDTVFLIGKSFHTFKGEVIANIKLRCLFKQKKKRSFKGAFQTCTHI